MNNEKYLRFAVPNGIDLLLLQQKLGNKGRQKALWLINKLVLLHSYYKDKEWIKLNSVLITKFLGNNYTAILKVLIDLNYIAENNSWKATKYSKGYKLLIKNVGIYTTCTDTMLSKNIIKDRIKITADLKLKACSDINSWLLNNLYDAKITPIYPNVVIYDYIEWFKMVKNDNAILVLESGNMDFKEDQYGRRHTPITRLSKEYRKFLSFKSTDDNNLYEIDIINSQLVFLLLTMLNEYNVIYNSKNIPVQGDTIICAPKCKDFLLFKKDVEEGQIYDKIMEAIGEPNRKAAKKELFRRILFRRIPKDRGEGSDIPIIKYFIKTYPSVWEYVLNAKEKNHRELAWDMQQKESDFIYNKVTARIKQLYPTARLWTIHDSFICEEKHRQDIIDIINDEFKTLGVQAGLRVDPLKNPKNKAEETDSEIMVEIGGEEDFEDFDEFNEDVKEVEEVLESISE